MRKIFTIIFVLLIFCASIQPVFAQRYVQVTSNTGALVIHVIDGDSMRVRLTTTGEEALVRLICVDASGNDDAFNYLNSRLMGKYITLEPDANMNYTDRWNIMYVNYQGEDVSADMLSKGFAQLNTAHRNAYRYYSLSGFRDNAQINSVGLWYSGDSDDRYAYTGNGVNINTASAAQMQNIFAGVSSSLAQNIVEYRDDNPFNTIGEIKFVSGMTRDIFNANRRYMTVSTNIRSATRDELLTLANITSAMVSRIIDYRDDYGLNRVSVLINEALVSDRVYTDNEQFVSTSNRTNIPLIVPDRVVNINTASRDQLTNVGLTSRQADALIQYRDRYGYKTLDELEFVPGVAFSKLKLDELSDNLNVMTDLNNATLNELRSLLGSSVTTTAANNIYNNRPYTLISDVSKYVSGSVYNALKDFVYIGSVGTERVNLNTAQTSDFTKVGFSSWQASEIISRRPYKYSGDFRANMSITRGSFYTNVNEAGRTELRSLSPQMTDIMIDRIISYRNDQPFGSQAELLSFFEGYNSAGLYYDLREYLVFR